MAQNYKTIDQLDAGDTGEASEVPVFQAAATKKMSWTSFFSGLLSLADAAAWRNELGIPNAMQFEGVIDASGNPNYPAAAKGDVYKISVAGKIGGASGAVVQAGDTIYCVVASAAGNQAAVGANWDIVQANIDGAVTGPASVVDSRVAAFDGTSGKLIKDGAKLVTDLATGPASAVDANLVAFNGTGGKALKDSGIKFQTGNFTPGFAFGGASVGMTYTFAYGKYTKIGNVVTFTAIVNFSAKGSSTGAMTMTGLPFPACSETNFRATFRPLSDAFSSGAPTVAQVLAGASVIGLYVDGPTTVATVNNTMAQDNSFVSVAGSYLTD